MSALATLAYGCLAVVADALARPVFWLLHRPPGGRR